MLNVTISAIKRFYYTHRFKLVKKELETMQKINAALSYNITWGLAVMIGFLQIFILIYKMGVFYYTLIPAFMILYAIIVYMLFAKQIWRFVIHAYCILSFAVMYIEIYLGHYTIDVNVMLCTTMIVFMAFSLLKKEVVSFYIIGVLLTFLIFLFQTDIKYSAPSRHQFIYIAMYAMLVLSFVAFICHHFIRSMYMVIRKLQFTANKRKVLSSKLLQITEETRESLLNKEEFLSTMSHELRSPLNTVIGFAALLQEEELSKKQKENLSYLQSSAKNLLDLINDVLDYNKFESGNLILEKGHFDVIDMLIDENSVFQQRIKNEEIKLEIRLDNKLKHKFFQGDKVRIQQMIYNLIYVVYKMNTQTLVELEIFFSKINASGQSEIVFNIFFEGFNKYLTYLSSDFDDNVVEMVMDDSLLYLLHTAISKKIAQEMQVEISYRFDAFTTSSNVQLKVAWSEIKLFQSLDKPEIINYSGVKVLIVDDQELNLLLVTKLLKKMGVCVKVAHSGMDAIASAKNTSFDIILMDVNMPDVNGFEASKQIKSFDENVKIIVLTGEEKSKIDDQLNVERIDGYLQKPVNSKSLNTEMGRVLQLKRSTIIV